MKILKKMQKKKKRKTTVPLRWNSRILPRIHQFLEIIRSKTCVLKLAFCKAKL